MITKMFNKTIAVFLTAIFIFGLIPAAAFAQPNPPSSLGEVKGFNRSVFDSHFSRADREISPERWLAEAKLGVSQALYAWELTASRLYEDPQAFEEEKNKVEKWSDEELEKRFSQWLIGRFFGEVTEKALMNLSSSLGEIQKNYSWHLDEEGNVVFDDKTGDPLIIRPDDEGRDFSRDLLKWRNETDKIVKTSGVSFDAVLLNLYPELLEYIPDEMRETLLAIISETGNSASASVKREFENIAAREERIFTSRRTRDIFSLRKKSDDEAAKLFTENLIVETEEACRQGIEELTARIEQAEAGAGDLALIGEEWLRLYREQFEKGLKAWEEAEERFFIRRIEWEQESFKLFSEGEEIWFAAFSQFEDERQKWELKAKELFQSGERMFINISEDFQKNIAEAKKEFELNMEMRIGAGTSKVKALIDMYLVCASAAISAGENVIFWLKYYGININKNPSDPDFAQWLLNERTQIWKIAENSYLNKSQYTQQKDELENLREISEMENSPEAKKIAEDEYYQYLEFFYNNHKNLFYIQDIIDGKIKFDKETAFAKKNQNLLSNNYDKYEKLVEIQKAYDVYTSYLDKALDARDRILADYAELIGTGALKDILSPNVSTEDFYLDEYQIALVRAKALVLYWERKTAIAEAVMGYAEELSAGRMTEAEGIRALEDAKAAYNESLAVYENELGKLNELGDDIHNQQEVLNRLTGEMQRAEEKLNKLNSDYSIFVNISAVNRAEYYLSALYEKYNLLVEDYKLFLKTGVDAVYRNAFEYGLNWSLSNQREDAEAVLDKLINGDKGTTSLAELEDKASKGLVSETELKIRLAGIDLFFDADNGKPRYADSDYSGADWYAAARGLNLSDEEKASLYGDKLKARLTADYKNASRLLLEKRLEFELEDLINFLKENHNSGRFEYAMSELCLLNADTAAKVWEILSALKNRMTQGKNVYSESDEENELISYFIYGGSFFDGSNERLTEYFDEYSFCTGLLELYINYAPVSSFGQKEAWNVTRNSLASLFAGYGIKPAEGFLPDAGSIYEAIGKKDGDFVQNTAQFLKDFNSCFTLTPQWLEYEIENWKYAFMEYTAANMYHSGIQPEKTISDLYFDREKLYSANEELYLYAYSQNYMEDDEIEMLNDIFMEINGSLLLIDHMGQITMYLDILRYEETAAESEKHWRNYLEGINPYNSDPAITIVSAWKDGILADAQFSASYFTNRINDSFTLFSQRDNADTEANSALNKNLYLEEISRINNKFSSLEFQYSDIVYLSRAYEFTQLETNEIYEQKKALFDEITAQEAEFNALRDEFFIEAEKFLASGFLYDEQYNILRTAQNNTDQFRFEYEKQDAIRRWASTAYLDKETIDPEYFRTKLTRAQTVMSVLSDIYNNEDSRPYNDPQYYALYSEYEKSFNRKFKALEALDSVLLSTAEERARNEELLTGYKASLNNLGYVYMNYENYTLPAEMKGWTVKDFITVKNGRLVFNKNDSMKLYGVNASIAENLNDFFNCDESNLSSFEESLLALSQRMSGYFADKNKLVIWGLARDYLISSLINANENVTYLKSQYSGMGDMTEGGSLGKLIVKPGISLLDFEKPLFKLLTEYERVNPFSTLFFTPNPKYENYEDTYRMAWNKLSAEEKADLEYYTILSLSGNSYSKGFSYIYTLNAYEVAYDYVNGRYRHAENERSKWWNFLLFLSYDYMISINYSALNNIRPAYEETKGYVENWKNGITQNLSSIRNYTSSYKESCEKLAALEVKKENEKSIEWDDISKALGYIKNLKKEDIEGIRISWEEMRETSAENFSTIPEALSGLYRWAKLTENNNKKNLDTFWQYSAQERLNNEYNYQAAVDAYLAGTGNIDDLKNAAENAFGKNAAAWKNHLANMHTALMNDLSIYTKTDKDFYGEFNLIGNELVMLTEKALRNRYGAELAAREIEWNYMLRDIEDKYLEWLDSAALIFENGRSDWSAGLQKMQESYRQWLINFENEYSRVNEEWTIAYLAGLDDKERWLEQAAAAANQASEDSFLSLLGTEGERLSRLMDTREPLGIRGAFPQAQSLMTELLQSSGIANMANAFSSMNNISSTASTVVRRGMGGVSTWDAVLVKSAATDLARKTNAETAAAEAKKLAYNARMNADQIINGLAANVQSANQGFRENMDDMFIMNGLWRRSGSNYVKDVVKGSTLFVPVISETVTIKGYADYIMEPVSIQTNLDEDFLSALDAYTIHELIKNVLDEVSAYRDIIFGNEKEKPKDIGRKGDSKEKRTQSPGKFGKYIGYDPDVKSNIEDITREAIFHDEGAGELGRLLADFTYWQIIDSKGKSEQALPGWDKRMWDDTGSFFAAPTIRSVGQIAGSIVSGVVSFVLTAATGGVAAAAIPFITAGINTLDDLIFGTLDASLGFKTWDEAGFEMGKALLINTASSLVGVGFNGIQIGGNTAIQGLTTTFTNAVNDSTSKILIQTAMAGAQTAVTSLTTSALNGITYDSVNKWGYNTDIFNNGAKDILGSTISSMASTLTTGTLQFINSGINMEKLESFNKLNKEDLKKLNGLAGSLVGQAVNYAFGKDFTLNLLNISLLNNTGLFDNKNLEGGLLELHLDRDGAKMNFGTGGANISIDNLAAAFRGIQVWDVNNQIGRYVNSNDFDSAIALRAQYGYGDDRQKSQLWDILKRRAEIRTDVGGDFTAETTTENGKRVINLSGYQSNMSTEDQMRIAVILGHEAYRDGIVTDDNNIETGSATLAHTEMAIRMLLGGENGFVDQNLAKDIYAYLDAKAKNDFNAFNAYVDANYDSSGDYWKLLRNGTLVNNNTGWLTDEDGKPILNADGEQIGAVGIETGLLNILFGGTHGVGYDEYSIDQIKQVQDLMITALMNYHSEKNGDIRTRYWTGNAVGQPLNIQYTPTQAEITQPAATSNVNTSSKMDQFVSWAKNLARPMYNGARDFISSAKDGFNNAVNSVRNWFSPNRTLPQENNRNVLNNQIDRGNYVTIPENFFSNIMNDDIMYQYSKENNGGIPQCNTYVKNMVFEYFGDEIYRNIFEGKDENANAMFLSFRDNPYLERINPFEIDGGLQAIQQMADDGFLILLSSQRLDYDENNKRISGHIAFIGSSNLTFSTKYSQAPEYDGMTLADLNGPNLNGIHLVVVQAGVYPGITSIRWATDGWLKPTIRNDRLENELYFYRVRSSL